MSARQTSTAPAKSPDAYDNFTPLFERLSPPLVAVLRGLLDQFEILASDFSPPRAAQLGDFEGLGGVTLRGDIGRVVHSELLLRTEAPMEFLRRLAEGETLYHDALYVDPGERPVYRAIISVGPGSLGHGRLVGLATLFFMARTAAVQNAAFHWCFLPRAEGAVWFDELSVNNIKRLLRSASHREVSNEDVAEAHALWLRLADDAADATARTKARPIDWVIGAHGRQPVQAGPVETAANGLSFAISAPRRDHPRTATLGLRRFGRLRKPIVLSLPDDVVCVGALRNPFRPPASPIHPAGASVAPRSRPGASWAPQYLVNASVDMKLVRMVDGLLFLRFGADGDVAQSVFIPIGASVRLAGLRLYRWGVTMVTHMQAADGERLTLDTYQLPETGRALRTFRRAARATSAQLFKQQPAYALPSLSQIGGVRIYSTSGMAFKLTFGNGEDMTFQPLYEGPRVLASDGVYEVVRTPGKNGGRIEVLRPTGYPLHSFDEGAQPLQPPALQGLVYSRSSSSLAYSLSPNRWRFATPGAEKLEDRDHLTLKPYETLLAVRATNDVVGGRIWSDARYGGEGEIRGVRVIGDVATPRGAVIKLAANIVAVNIGDDGMTWAVSATRAGEPDSLIRYAKHKSGGGYTETRFELGRYREKAQVLDAGRSHD